MVLITHHQRPDIQNPSPSSNNINIILFINHNNMMPHLHNLLQWNLLSDMPFFRVGKTTPLTMKSGKCNKIHILNKNDQNKIDNRKYIDENDICGDSRCKTDTTICVVNKNNQFKWIYCNSIATWINKLSKYTVKEHNMYYNFMSQYSKTLNQFADDYLRKKTKHKVDKHTKLFILPDEYNDDNIEELMVKRVNEYYNTTYIQYVIKEHSSVAESKYKNQQQKLTEEIQVAKDEYSSLVMRMENVIKFASVTPNMNELENIQNTIHKLEEAKIESTKLYKQCMSVHASASDYDWVYALISSENENDILYLLNRIKLDDNFLYRIVNEWGTQCYGRYANFIHDRMTQVYFDLNILISSGNFHNSEAWGGLNYYYYLTEFIYEADFHGMVPKWKHEYFEVDKFYGCDKNSFEFKIKDYIKLDKVNELLKKIFRYSYIWLSLFKYSKASESLKNLDLWGSLKVDNYHLWNDLFTEKQAKTLRELIKY